MEIDKGNAYVYEGNYEKYIELKMQREQMLIATEQKNMNIYRKELEDFLTNTNNWTNITNKFKK